MSKPPWKSLYKFYLLKLTDPTTKLKHVASVGCRIGGNNYFGRRKLSYQSIDNLYINVVDVTDPQNPRVFNLELNSVGIKPKQRLVAVCEIFPLIAIPHSNKVTTIVNYETQKVLLRVETHRNCALTFNNDLAIFLYESPKGKHWYQSIVLRYNPVTDTLENSTAEPTTIQLRDDLTPSLDSLVGPVPLGPNQDIYIASMWSNINGRICFEYVALVLNTSLAAFSPTYLWSLPGGEETPYLVCTRESELRYMDDNGFIYCISPFNAKLIVQIDLDEANLTMRQLSDTEYYGMDTLCRFVQIGSGEASPNWMLEARSIKNGRKQICSKIVAIPDTPNGSSSHYSNVLIYRDYVVAVQQSEPFIVGIVYFKWEL
jgi:hypothetical protein